MKRRDRGEFPSMSWGAAKGDHHRSSGGGASSGGSPFSLSRFLPSRSRRRHHSKSRMSLDSDSHSTKSELSLASHNVTSTSLPAFHNSGVALTPLARTHNTNVAMAAGSLGVAVPSSLPSSSLALPTPSPAPSESNVSGSVRECPVCMMEQTLDSFPPIQTCDHRTCLQCLRHYLQIEISESRINIACPECNERFHPNDMRAILENDVLMRKYEDFMLRRVLAMDPDTRWCPAPDCGYAVIAAGCAGCPKLKCERDGCNTYFCYHCKQHWHPNQTCDAARAERSPNIRSASLSYSHESGAQNEIKPCPRCGAFIVKMNDGSCNHMTCAVCAAEFCWLCMKEISDLHYLSPSGCTFWGRKPWSRKKKILWQLGTLVGAPVGITLVAGIAVPAMIIGIPVWVGRKIHTRYRMSSKHRRNLAVTGGVAASILASPVVAGLAVGIGVPILLAYVYGVVPISLCRSGGCGVTTTNTGGVRFDFDEENEANAQGNFSGDNQSETMPAVANPSIAPSIGDASLGMTNSLSASGSHMERVGIIRDADSDRDSASNRAIASASLNGSLCGSTYTNKLEVQADVVPGGGPQKRASFSSESANISLSEKSATVSFDETSLRVLYSEGPTRDNMEGHNAESDAHDTDAVYQNVDTTSPTSPSTPHSPRPFSRTSANGEESRHSTKCKKLTRFVDDIPLVSPNSNIVVTGNSHSNIVVSGNSHAARGTANPPTQSCVRAEVLTCPIASKTCFEDKTVEDEPSRLSKFEDKSLGEERSKLCKVEKREDTPLRSSKLKEESLEDSKSKSSKLDDKNWRADHSKYEDKNFEGIRSRSPKLIASSKMSVHDELSLHSVPMATFQETDFPSVIGTKEGAERAVLELCETAMSHVSIYSEISASQVLPEVDTDKPVASRQSSHSLTTESESLSLRGRSLSLSCSSLDKKLEGACSGPSATEKVEKRSISRSVRRHSYELAYKHGRISPSLFDEHH